MYDALRALTYGGPMRHTRVGFIVAMCAISSCSRGQHSSQCPAQTTVKTPISPVSAEHQDVDYWLARQPDVDAVLLDANAIASHNAALSEHALGQVDLHAPIDPSELVATINERLGYVAERVDNGTYRDDDGREISADALGSITEPPPIDVSWHVANRLLTIRCSPIAGGLHTVPVDRDFDRNACSTVRKGEVVQRIAAWPDGQHLVRTSYTMGWLQDDAPLSPSIDPTAADKRRPPPSPLTRRALLTEAFSMLGQPYGWAGRAGGYDCSRLLLTIFDRFGLGLPRHSRAQSKAGSFSIDVAELEDASAKLDVIDVAHEHGAALLHFPGHIMLYLGRDASGIPMALHAFSEFLTPCADGGGDTVRRVDEVAVTDLSLGEGSKRRDFLSRIDRVTVIGRPPDARLVGSAALRPAATPAIPDLCEDTEANAIFQSPHKPNLRQPLTVVATSTQRPAHATLVLYGPDGAPRPVTQSPLDGPPHSVWVRTQPDLPGQWTAVFGDGTHVVSCERFTVYNTPAKVTERTEPGPVYTPRWRWEQDTENLFSAFVEQLFREPDDDETTWPDLQTLTRDPARNLLFDHHHPGEDARLTLQPDCADLPYFLRGYFAYKLSLPFAFRDCSRGTKDRAPACTEEITTSLFEVDARDDTRAFQMFARKIAGTVHSASARTRPRSENSDVYPVALERSQLPPGTVFADPYGHLLVVARWKPQTATDYGVLIGADAQPDGTVGRRRFWRGSFLFDPDTSIAGPGFKAWRPVRFNRRDNLIEARDNSATLNSRAPLSMAQYQGTADDFYDQMDRLINPRALKPQAVLTTLIDALQETVARRVVSVDNGEAYARSHDPMAMPTGYSIFETIGPWEDFATPSRDMRLLISIDAVAKFPERVKRDPERFGITQNDAPAALSELQRQLTAALNARMFTYKRSNDSAQTLSLADVVARTGDLEMAYNPNDCIEIRWGAPEGSEERRTCKRRAPQAQHKRMQAYRAWFAERKRPPR